MIAWKYINKTDATVSAIRDYNSMRSIINITPDEIKEVYEKMTSPRSPNLSGMPSSHDPMAAQDKLASQIDKLDLLRERYSQAIAYMNWFEPAFSSLTDTEKTVIREFYMGDNQRSGATYRLMEMLHCSESSVERIRSKAFSRLRSLLFG